MPRIAFSRFSSGSVEQRICTSPSDTDEAVDADMELKIMPGNGGGIARDPGHFAIVVMGRSRASPMSSRI
jgi:hypothetical protein